MSKIASNSIPRFRVILKGKAPFSRCVPGGAAVLLPHSLQTPADPWGQAARRNYSLEWWTAGRLAHVLGGLGRAGYRTRPGSCWVVDELTKCHVQIGQPVRRRGITAGKQGDDLIALLK